MGASAGKVGTHLADEEYGVDAEGAVGGVGQQSAVDGGVHWYAVLRRQRHPDVHALRSGSRQQAQGQGAEGRLPEGAGGE